MTSTKVGSGETITSTGTETAWTLKGPYDSQVPIVTLTLISGSYQYGIASIDSPPILDSSYTTLSTAGDKKLVSFNPAIEQLRVVGTATIHPSY